MLSRLRALFLAVGVGMVEGRNPSQHPVPGFCSRPEVVALAERADHDDLRRMFADTYNHQLHKLGYIYTDIGKSATTTTCYSPLAIRGG